MENDSKSKNATYKMLQMLYEHCRFTSSEINDIESYYKTDTEFRLITGHSLQELKELFLAGYHLESPDTQSFQSLSDLAQKKN